MADLSMLIDSIRGILDDPAYTDEKIVGRINKVIPKISAGIRMPNGVVSPPLPDLYTYGTVDTSTTLPYVSLPVNYQRGVFNVYDSTNYRISPPSGGDYYAFSLFMSKINNMGLAESGSIYRVCVKGTKLYYQGIPTVSVALGVHYYRKPVDLALDSDEPDGIPEHLAEDLVKHGVLKDIYGDIIEAGVTEPSRGMEYHTRRFYEAMTDLIDFIGIDSEPKYYGSDDFEDAGVCD